MDKWSKVTLGDICDVKGGKRLPKGSVLTDAPTPHPYIRVRDLNNKRIVDLDESFEYVDIDTQKSISRYIVNSGDIIISIVGTIGLVSIVGETLHNANLTENCVKLVNFSNADPLYIYYFLQSVYGQDEIAKGAVGAVQAKLPIKNIKDIRIYTPPLSEQRRIAAILSALDDKIELNSQINKNLEAQAQAIFKSWFVDFEPWGGAMPEDWREGKLGEICGLVIRGITPKYSDASNEIVLNQKCIRNHQVNIELSRKHIPKAINDKWLKYGDVLINSTGQGTLGRAAQWFDNTKNVTVDSHITIIRAKNQNQIYYIGRLIMESEHDIEKMAAGSTGQTELSRERLKSMDIIVPTGDILAKFNLVLTPLCKLIVENNQQSKTLSAIRDSLLPKLMNGEIKVPPEA